ncbi:olfactory receptor 5P66-like [Clytia hemisphaerica]|uniref:olfactory receptor 5P66-like n=1 Tax=Clytia hemisphaerica TaxID=252671 RepID=UPI0034D63338
MPHSSQNQSTHQDIGSYRVECVILEFLYDSREVQLEVNISSNIAFNFILSILIMIINGIIAYVMLIHAKYKTPSYFLLLNNAIVDAIFPSTLVSWNFILLEIMDYNAACTFINASLYLGYVFGSISMILANMMALDRYLAIFKPFFYHERIVINYMKYGPYIFAGWLFSIVFVGLSLLTPKFTMFYGFAALTLSLTIVFGSYVYIRVHFLVKNITEKTYPSIKQREREERRRKHDYYMNRLTSAMIFVLLVCYAPFTIYSMIFLTASKLLTTKAYAGVLWAYTFIYCKSIGNPLLFCISMTTLRRDIGRLFTRKDNMVHAETSRNLYHAEGMNVRTRQDKTLCSDQKDSNLGGNDSGPTTS